MIGSQGEKVLQVVVSFSFFGVGHMMIKVRKAIVFFFRCYSCVQIDVYVCLCMFMFLLLDDYCWVILDKFLTCWMIIVGFYCWMIYVFVVVDVLCMFMYVYLC